jgi:hypothetical protein
LTSKKSENGDNRSQVSDSNSAQGHITTKVKNLTQEYTPSPSTNLLKGESPNPSVHNSPSKQQDFSDLVKFQAQAKLGEAKSANNLIDEMNMRDHQQTLEMKKAA